MIHRPKVYFDIGANGQQFGRIEMELFADVCPRTAENFRALCTGEKGNGRVTGKPLHYSGCAFHGIEQGSLLRCGDISNGAAAGGESIYGGNFDCEASTWKHDAPFLLSMVNMGSKLHGSQFLMLTQPCQQLDDVHIVFGRVTSGFSVLKLVEAVEVDASERPLQDVRIVASGELAPTREAPCSAEIHQGDRCEGNIRLRSRSPRRPAPRTFQGNRAKVPYLDFAPDFIEPILSGAKRATARCPGPKDTDVTSDLEAVITQGWALATCSSGDGQGFAVLKIEAIERMRFDELDDRIAKIEGLSSGDELRSILGRFYPGMSAGDQVVIVHLQVLHRIGSTSAAETQRG